MNTHALLIALAASAVALAAYRPVDAALISPDSARGLQGQDVQPGDNGDAAQAIYTRGLDALRAGDLDAAERAFTTATQINPRMPQPLVGLADIAQKRGNTDQAAARLQQALAVAPDDDGVHYALAIHHINTKDYAAAETELKRVIQINPRQTIAQLDLANLYATGLGRPSDAIATYRTVLAADPKHAGAHQGLAMALATTGQFKEAETEFRQAADLVPGIPLPLHSLARMQLGRGQTDAGLAALDAALKIQPQFVPALLDKGDVLLGAGKAEAALALYDRAVAAEEKSAAAHFKRGTVLQMQKRNVEAKQAYVTVISLDNAFAPAYNNLAWMQVEAGDNLNQASQWAATAVKLAPENAAFRDTQGWVYRAQRQYAEAETVLEKAATMKPAIADIQYHLGVVYLDQKKPDQARRAFTQALAIDPKHAPSKAALQKLDDAS